MNMTTGSGECYSGVNGDSGSTKHMYYLQRQCPVCQCSDAQYSHWAGAVLDYTRKRHSATVALRPATVNIAPSEALTSINGTIIRRTRVPSKAQILYCMLSLVLCIHASGVETVVSSLAEARTEQHVISDQNVPNINVGIHSGASSEHVILSKHRLKSVKFTDHTINLVNNNNPRREHHDTYHQGTTTAHVHKQKEKKFHSKTLKYSSRINDINSDNTDSIQSFSSVEYSNADKRLPKALIIGVKKGGTRALLEFLRMHPDVKAPGPEIHFFDKYYNKGLNWYRNQMPSTNSGQLTIEKTPSYMVTKDVPRRIYTMSKQTRLIVVLRDPVTRAISDYTQTASKFSGTKRFEDLAFLDNSTGAVDTSWSALRIGIYAIHLTRWLDYFPLSQIHFVSGERLITDPAGEIARVQQFLGLEPLITEKHFLLDSEKGFPCLRKHADNGRPHCLGKTKGRKHPDVAPRLLKRLRDFYRPFNIKLYKMVGQNFGWE